MTTAAKSAFGTVLTWNSQTVAEITSIGGVELSIDMIDVTNHQSTSGYEEAIAGITKTGEVSIEGNFVYTDTNGQLAMITDAAAKTSRTAVITGPSSIYSWSFTAFISKIKIGDSAHDGKIPFSASLKVTGVPTFATTASNNLSALSVTTGILYPVFAAGTYEYAATSTGNTCTVTATFAAGTCTLTANGVSQALTTTVPSSAIDLGDDGDMTEITIVVQETNKTAKTYTIWVANAAA
jgi:predicted secreted protein